jgi:hypothetical protein
MARPERFELPTAWFVVSSTIANFLFFNTDYWNARCPICTTMQDDAQPNPAKLPQPTITRPDAIDLRHMMESPWGVVLNPQLQVTTHIISFLSFPLSYINYVT